ncbi:phenylalanine--tRNA ligase subunit alpha [Candidatus Saccharibacteria bacterium]|nr:phenylalanine--tRNA ligase subunit alpha [Candidatus Saccharibacteria bacterium]
MNTLADLKSELKSITAEFLSLKNLSAEERKQKGIELNEKKQSIIAKIKALENSPESTLPPVDITAPFADNATPSPLKSGSIHPLMSELEHIVDIYAKMGFNVMESVQLDDEFHMFDSLNFPKDHPARDSYDTFRTSEGFIPPAHTSTMQYRALKKYKDNLENGGEIAVVIPGRVFRNEDVDPTHEHTFYQCEGVFVSKSATVGNLIAIWKQFFEIYYGEKLNIKTQPSFFPFTEPSFEFLLEKPKSLGGKGDGWLEMGGCGMIHPNILKTAGIDPTIYRGFAWGGGIDRLVMLKHTLSDVRFFESGKLEFLENFSC